MLFQTFTFMVFFFLLIIIFVIEKKTTKRKVYLLIFSYIFYMFWNPVFILLIIFSTIIDYLIGHHLYTTESSKKRKQLLFLSIFANLGVLFFFKYGNFFQDNCFLFLQFMGYEPSWTSINITLPVGISFYTFQTMSYTIDVYRKRISPCKSILDFSLFVSFFPQLVAGPIVKARYFLPQLNSEIKMCWNVQSFFLIVKGLVKKVIIADNIAIFVDFILDKPIGWNSSVILFAMICFYVQLYCDFSGYSDMAIGFAKILGFNLPENFKRPYFAMNISDFWRRWHISLSSWLKEYLYVPLGGNIGGNFKIYRNILITMVLGGIWHGAGWSYIIWGALHGIGLIFHRIWKKIYQPEKYFLIYKLLSLLLTQFWFLFALVFFRLHENQKIEYCVRKILIFDFDFKFKNVGLGSNGSLFLTLWLVFFFFILHIYSHLFGEIYQKISNMSPFVIAMISMFIGMIFFLLWPVAEKPFIYFQF